MAEWMFGILLCLSTAYGITGQGQTTGKSTRLALLDMSQGFENRLRANSTQVTFARNSSTPSPSLDVTVKLGKEDFPGLNIRPSLTSWNLSAFGHVEARVTNTGTKTLHIALRVDNEGDWKTNPWNTESVFLDPGATQTITTMFGYSYGLKPGFKLKPQAVTNVLLFVVQSDAPQSFRIESVEAAGPTGEKPPVAPDDVRVKPASGIVFGSGATIDLSSQVQAQGVQPLLVGTDKQPSLRVVFPPSKADQTVSIKPAVGRWDLSRFLQVQVAVRNMGKTPFTPKARLETNGGVSEWFAAATPIAAGASGTITVPFAVRGPIVMGSKVPSAFIASDAVRAVSIASDSPDFDRLLYIDSVQGTVPINPDLPAWVGQRPPVEGEWIKTLDDEFDGTKIDSSIWDIYGENYYDKVTHWSKEDVNVSSGVVKLKYEKKLGFGNDDPKRPRTDYAAGYLTTYGKWVQRYGYFEARMKLPKAAGLWPAFWLMPDRGGAASPQYVRQDTANGGMEFDIMEHLTRWGPNRYNISMHYDGYGATHKSLGSDKIYVQPDKDGYITCGLLWTPGLAVYYCNGHEVLRWEDIRVSNVPSCFLFTLPSGGWDNNAIEDSQLPDEFVIDYVRVWQRKDLASSVDGKQGQVGKTN